jgi:hypothetical protein
MSWPSQSWLAEIPSSEDNRFFVFSLVTVLFLGILSANLATLSRWSRALPPPQAGRFLGAALLLLAAGLLQGW